MTLRWQAQYLNGSSATAHTAVVSLVPHSIEISTNNRTLHWPYKEVIQTMGFYPSEPVRLERGAEAIVVTDHLIIEAIKKSKKRLKNPKGPLRGLRLFIWLPILLAISLGVTSAIYFKGIPYVAEYIAGVIPASLEERLGLNAEKVFLNGFKEYDNPKLVKNVKSILTRLETAAGKTPDTIKLRIIDAPVRNAFALPGNRLILFRGIIEETKSAQELAGVMAHEIAHIKRRHATKGLLQHLSVYMLFSFIAGDMNTLSSITSNLGSMRYSREFETEADRLATRILIDANIDPAGLITFFATNAKPTEGINNGYQSGLKYLSTHPDTNKRVKTIKRERARYVKTATYPALLPDVNWKELTNPARHEPNGGAGSSSHER